MNDSRDSAGRESRESSRDSELADQLEVEDSESDAVHHQETVADGADPVPNGTFSEPSGPLTPPTEARSGADTAGGGESPEAVGADSPTELATSVPWKPKHRRVRPKAPWWEFPALILLAIVVAVLVKSFLIQPFYIPSASMENTLYGATSGGDRILVNKLILDFRDPEPGDIVVFNAPPGWNDEAASTPPSNPVLRLVRGFGQLVGVVPPDGLVLVKRVIASSGQCVQGVANSVYVSEQAGAGHCPALSGVAGQPAKVGAWRKLTEPYVFENGPDGRASFGPVAVPKGRLWVMGDHRNDSADSRFHCDAAGNDFGAGCNPMTSTVPQTDVIGKAFVIAWPPSRWRTLGTPSTFENSTMTVGDGLPIYAALLLVIPVYLVRRRRRVR